MDKNGAKCNMGFGRVTENTLARSRVQIGASGSIWLPPASCDDKAARARWRAI